MNKETKKKTIIGGIIGLVIIVIIILLLKGCQAKKYMITFDTNGGSTVESVKVKEKDQITKPSDPTREGYDFAGWYYNGKLFDFNKEITKDMKLKAKWVKSIEEMTIEDLSLKVGESKTITVKIKPSDRTVTLVWSSSDSSIVSVDKNGKVTAKKAGKVTITVKTKDGKYKASCEVTVTEDTPQEVAPETTQSNTTATRRPQSGGTAAPQPSAPQQPVQDSYVLVITRLITQAGSNLQNRIEYVTKNGVRFSDYTAIVIDGDECSPGEKIDSGEIRSVQIVKNGVVIGTASVSDSKTEIVQ